jgi:pimeloyl-ACP methyl ester carboxylesterase
VTLAWPPAATLLSLRSAPLLALRQARLSWYMLFQQLPIVSERVLPALIPRLWAAWSPGYDASEDLEHVGQSLHSRERRVAALGYYRALLQPWKRSREYAPEQRHLYRLPPVPLLYLHGETDGCARADVAGRTEALLPAGSRFELIPDAGHFLHLERPDYVNPRIAEFIERRS